MYTDPISDYLTRIRNAQAAGHKLVDAACELADKLKEWYDRLGDIHCFLDGVNIKKKDVKPTL